MFLWKQYKDIPEFFDTSMPFTFAKYLFFCLSMVQWKIFILLLLTWSCVHNKLLAYLRTTTLCSWFNNQSFRIVFFFYSPTAFNISSLFFKVTKFSIAEKFNLGVGIRILNFYLHSRLFHLEFNIVDTILKKNWETGWAIIILLIWDRNVTFWSVM